MSSQRIRIPEQAYGGLSELASLSDDDFQKLLDGLKNAPPSFQQDEYEAHVAARVELSSNTVSEIIDFILPLYAVRYDMGVSIPQFSNIIGDAINRIPSEKLGISDESKSLLGGRIGEVLALEKPMAMISKARYITHQHERMLIDSRIFTELRPVFQENPDNPPVAGVILHRLKIDYFENGGPKEFFITMDAGDIEKLRQVLSRADRKAASLRSLLSTTSMQILETDSDE